MKNWTLELPNGSQFTLYEHAIAYIQWRYDEPASDLPDKCNVILQGTGQTLEFWRDQTRELYRDIVSEKERQLVSEDKIRATLYFRRDHGQRAAKARGHTRAGD